MTNKFITKKKKKMLVSMRGVGRIHHSVIIKMPHTLGDLVIRYTPLNKVTWIRFTR